MHPGFVALRELRHSSVGSLLVGNLWCRITAAPMRNRVSRKCEPDLCWRWRWVEGTRVGSMDELVDQDGHAHNRGWDGSFHQEAGSLRAQARDRHLNPTIERDWLGNPKAKTDWLGNPVTNSAGQPLYKSSGGGGGGGAGGLEGVVGWLLGLALVAVFALAFFLIKLLYRLCRDHPQIGYPVVLGLVVVGALVAASASQPSVASSRSTDVVQSAPPRTTPLVAASPTARPAPATATSVVVTQPKPTPARSLVVANTDGQGVYIRRTPRMNDRLIAWPVGTVLQPTGPTAAADGHAWHEVRDPKGNVGWVPDDYVRALPRVSARRARHLSPGGRKGALVGAGGGTKRALVAAGGGTKGAFVGSGCGAV
jgi:hypothetical protein